jgi:hypothetical protein
MYQQPALHKTAQLALLPGDAVELEEVRPRVAQDGPAH